MTAPTSPGVVPADDVGELVERLRTRAESEREIQRNNEAVAAALSGQLEAFKRQDGTHNTFAVRLGLDHQNCARKDAALAADWDAAADMLERLANRPSLTEDERGQVRREPLEEAARSAQAWRVIPEDFIVPGAMSAEELVIARRTAKGIEDHLRALADRSEPRQEKEILP